MKKILAMLLVLTMALALVACGGGNNTQNDAGNDAANNTANDTTDTTDNTSNDTAGNDTADDTTDDTADDAVTVMTHADYAAAELDSAVVVETYVQNHQSWWDNKITVYCQSPDGAYFLYELACSEEDAAKLVPGTKIRVSGYKGEWAGEVEIMDGTFEFVEGGDTFVAEALDVTELLGTDELIAHQNEFVAFTGMSVEAIEYKNGEPGDDIYVTLGYNGASYDFCVEIYLTGADSDVYTTVGELEVGDVVNVEGFLYWYEGVNPHITAISVAE